MSKTEMEPSSSSSAVAVMEYDCPVYGNNSDFVIDQTKFWVEGVGLSSLAIFGIVGNVFSCIVLSRPKMRNSFNMLLIALALFDTCYNAASLMETARKCFGAASRIQKLLYPHLLYPGQWICLTGTEFMVVAIAFERYVSVHHPIDYNMSMNDPREIQKRLFKYFVPVLLLSVGFNIPKFFETEAFVIYPDGGSGANSSTSVWDDYVVVLNVTDMRVDPIYSSWANWSQLFVLGVIPVCLLVYFNTKIYFDVRERERRRRPTQVNAAFSAPPPGAPPSVVVTTHEDRGAEAAVANEESEDMTRRRESLEPSYNMMREIKRKKSDSRSAKSEEEETTAKMTFPTEEHKKSVQAKKNFEAEEDDEGAKAPKATTAKSRRKSSSVVRIGEDEGPEEGRGFRLSMLKLGPILQKKKRTAEERSSNGSAHVAPPASTSSPPPPQNNSESARQRCNARRRRVEDRLAILFMGIVAINLTCHFPRILLNFYEMMVIEEAMACAAAGKRAFAVWAQVMSSVNSFLLVANSSLNIIIYSFFNKQFRAGARELLGFKKSSRSIGCRGVTVARGHGFTSVLDNDGPSALQVISPPEVSRNSHICATSVQL